MNKKMIKYKHLFLKETFIMLKVIKFSSIFIVLSIFTACAGHKKAMEVLPNELEQLNQDCKRDSLAFELDCYDFIATKNSFAMLRLGIDAQNKGRPAEAFERYTKAQKAGNFYANALLSTLYGNGLGVEFDEKNSINLLKAVEDVDPIAAYRLSYYYFSNGNPQKAIELLEYAATNEVKDAQKDLVLVYTNGQYIEPNDEKALFYDNLYQDGKEDFTKKIYGR